ncbi:hypothetical protein [Streptomyces sp. NRRL S-4]|uniref:hypothetical protein n=1 Tax=Streptomyces sp. NRRL S-4 TaxID=1519471 RepID=UPI0006B52B02|nr:hypothetical protein [Streptomyces sp. NRRL S-4]
MSTITVWKCRTAEGAENGGTALKSLHEEGRARIRAAAVVTWPAKRSEPKNRQLVNPVGQRGAAIGIDDDFLTELKQKVMPGTPALFPPALDEVE